MLHLEVSFLAAICMLASDYHFVFRVFPFDAAKHHRLIPSVPSVVILN
jgi:hypothetical protein